MRSRAGSGLCLPRDGRARHHSGAERAYSVTYRRRDFLPLPHPLALTEEEQTGLEQQREKSRELLGYSKLTHRALHPQILTLLSSL